MIQFKTLGTLAARILMEVAMNFAGFFFFLLSAAYIDLQGEKSL